MGGLFWDIHRAYWRMIGKAAKGSVSGAGKLMSQRVLRAPRSGILCPGDSSPPPGADVLDYRGLAHLSKVSGALAGKQPPIGTFLDCRGRRGPPLGLPVPLLFRHSAVLGPTGSGKTTSIIVPWIVSLLRLGCSVVTIDVRGDLLPAITAHAAATGGPTGSRLWLWDYSAPQSHRWNWLADATDSRAIEMAVTSILGRPKDNDPQPHFYNRDYRWLRALITLTKQSAGPAAAPARILSLINDQRALLSLMHGMPTGTQPAADLNDLVAMPADEYSRAASGLINALSIFGLPQVERVTTVSDFSLSGVCDRPTLLVAVAPLADGRLAETLSGMLVSQVILRVFSRFGNSQSPRPLFLMIDEAPRLKDRLNYEELLAVARGASVGVCLAAQDVTQFGDADTRTSILSNCQSLIVLPGTSPETAGYLSKRLGERPVEQVSVTQAPTGGFFGTRTVGGSSGMAPVLGLREIMHPPFGDHVSIAHIPSVTREPFLVDLSL
jgi:type IV secretory pathway TraG/TraD family ATPase VirD4